MSHKTSLIVTFLALLTACGSSQNVPERTEQVPDAVQALSPAPVATITVDQDANETVAPPPVQPSAPIVATPLPTVSPSPEPVATATPVPTPTPTAAPTCSQLSADGNSYNYTCGIFVISPLQGAGCPVTHAALMELTPDAQGNWYYGSYVVSFYPGGGMSWNQDGVTISGQGYGVTYATIPAHDGHPATQTACVFTVAPGN